MGAFINQASMAAGEVAPDLWGRVDQALYYIGMRTCLNYIIRQYGGGANRPGFKYTAETKDSTKKTRVIPFSFNEVQTYVLEFGDQFFRVIKDGAEVLEAAKTITAATKANPCVVTSAAHGFSNGDDVFITGVVGMVELNGRTFRVKNVAANTFELTDYAGNNINSTAYTTYSSGGTASRIFSMALTGVTEARLFELNYAQSNDVLTVVHPGFFPKDITRTGHTSWTVQNFDKQRGPFKDMNTTATTVYCTFTIVSVSNAFDNGSGLIRLTVTSTADLETGWEVNISGVGGVTNANGVWRITVIDGTHIDLIASTFAGVYTTGGSVAVTGRPGNETTLVASTGIFDSGMVGELFYLEQDPQYDNTKTWEVEKVIAKYEVRRAGSHYYLALNAATTGTVRPDHIEGTATDGDNGVRWEYLHSGFTIVKILSYSSSTSVIAQIIIHIPDLVSALATATTEWAKDAWSIAEGYPSACAYHKQRMAFGGTSNAPNTLWFSGVSARTFFGKSRPILDDEAITIKLDTVEVNAIRHLLPLKQLIALTSASEQLISGVDGLLLATETPNTDVQGYTGSSKVKPIIIGNTAIFVQDLGNVIRSLQYNLESDTFTGVDLSARSPHLFENKTVMDWAYQRHPFSVIWTIMSDGMLNGFTYMKEQEVYAWHRHQTDGLFESVCTIREGNETAAYFVIKRTINGVTKRYIERLSTRYFARVEDSYFVDCGLSYDGRNYTEDAAGTKVAKTATTITVSGGTTWMAPEVLTLTASASLFISTDVGNRITFWVDNIAYHLDITGYTSGTVVSAVPTKTIPVAYRTTAKTDWVFARTIFRPLHHIEGKAVAVLADGNVVNGLSVSNGMVTLPKAYGVVHIGLPYNSDLETLDMSSPPPGETKAKSLTIPRVFVTAKEARGLRVGASRKGFDDLTEIKPRNPDDGYDRPIPARNTIFEVGTNNDWSNQGRIYIRQPDPLPLTVTCITPEVVLGYS